MDDEVAAAWTRAAEELQGVDLSTEEGRREVLAAYRRARAVERRVSAKRRLRQTGSTRRR